jgi:hypothetical protein
VRGYVERWPTTAEAKWWHADGTDDAAVIISRVRRGEYALL